MTATGPLLSRREVGPVTIVVLVILNGALWLLARPVGEPTMGYLGQLLGAESVLLLSIALVLISTLPWVEVWFDGIDRAAIWHRRVAITGVVLLLPHILMAHNPDGGTSWGGPVGVVGAIGLAALAVWAIIPRWQSVVPRALRGLILAVREAGSMRGVRRLLGGYDRWRALHRTTGVFVAVGFIHGVMDGSPFDDSALLRWSYLAIGGIGIGFYVYRELLARFFLSLHDYQVHGVRRIDHDLVEISLEPIGRPVNFVPGQFAMVYIESKDGWHRHPFSIASAPHEGVVRVTVKALGDYTSSLHDLLAPGMPAVIGGPHGRFSHWKGTDRQVWIAGGVGIAPFLSWLRALEVHALPAQVDLFYSAAGEAAFEDEIRAIADQHPRLTAHIIDTQVEGRLTTDRVLVEAGANLRELSAFMCGPAAMVRTFQSELRAAGVTSRNIHREYFDWR